MAFTTNFFKQNITLMMKKRKKLTVKQDKELQNVFLSKLVQNYGLIYRTLDELRPSGMTEYKLNKQWYLNSEFKEKLNYIQEYMLDIVENQLLNLIKCGDRAAIMFYLKCKGRSRGWQEIQKIESEVKNIEPIEINYIIPDG